jgi:hypothetical protein
MKEVQGSRYFLEEQPWQAPLEVDPILSRIRINIHYETSPKGILAYAIAKMDGVGGRKGWQW